MLFSKEIIIEAPRNIQVQTIAAPYLNTIEIENFNIVLENTNGKLPQKNQSLLEKSINTLIDKGLSYEEILLVVFKEQAFLKKYLREKPEFASIKTSLLDHSFIKDEAQKRGNSRNSELFPSVFQTMVDYDTKNDIYQNTQYGRKKIEEILINPNFWLYTIEQDKSLEENEKTLIKYLPKKIRDKMFENYLQRYKEESNEIPICSRNISSIFHIHRSRVDELLNEHHINRTKKIFREKEFSSSEKISFLLPLIWEMMKKRKLKSEIKVKLGLYVKNLRKIFSSSQFEEYILNLPEEKGIDKEDLFYIYLGKDRKLEILNEYLAKLKNKNQNEIIDISKLSNKYHLDFYIVRDILKKESFNILEHPTRRTKNYIVNNIAGIEIRRAQPQFESQTKIVTQIEQILETDYPINEYYPMFEKIVKEYPGIVGDPEKLQYELDDMPLEFIYNMLKKMGVYDKYYGIKKPPEEILPNSNLPVNQYRKMKNTISKIKDCEAKLQSCQKKFESNKLKGREIQKNHRDEDQNIKKLETLQVQYTNEVLEYINILILTQINKSPDEKQNIQNIIEEYTTILFERINESKNKEYEQKIENFLDYSQKIQDIFDYKKEGFEEELIQQAKTIFLDTIKSKDDKTLILTMFPNLI